MEVITEIVTVDNNSKDLLQLADVIKKILPECQIHAFTNSLLSAKYICNNSVDLVFLADNMRIANGFKLIQVLRKNIPKLPIVMLSTESICRAYALVSGANGFLVKLVSIKELSSVIHGTLR